jgi:hypothetical protein
MKKWILLGTLFLFSQGSWAEGLVGKCSFAFNNELKDEVAKGDVFINIYLDKQEYSITHGRAEFKEALSLRESQLDQQLDKIPGALLNGQLHWEEGSAHNWIGLYLLNPNRLNHVLVAVGSSSLSPDPYPTCYFFE